MGAWTRVRAPASHTYARGAMHGAHGRHAWSLFGRLILATMLGILASVGWARRPALASEATMTIFQAKNGVSLAQSARGVVTQAQQPTTAELYQMIAKLQ